MITINKLKHCFITGTIFTLLLGSLSHFFYDWSGKNSLIGLFSPINESTWEHMKLLFFPMLLFSLIAIPKFKNIYPCIGSSLFFSVIAGTAIIPILFYTYTGILGYNLMFFDIATFVIAVLIAFYIAYRFTLSCRIQKYSKVIQVLVIVFIICFILFSLYPPDIGLFADIH